MEVSRYSLILSAKTSASALQRFRYVCMQQMIIVCLLVPGVALETERVAANNTQCFSSWSQVVDKLKVRSGDVTIPIKMVKRTKVMRHY